MSSIVLAAVSGGDAIKSLLLILVVGIVLGILYFLVNAAPFLNDLFKKVLTWIIIVFGALFLINVLLTWVGHPVVSF